MASTQTYAGFSAEQNQYFYSMRLLTRAVANFPHALVAQLGSTPSDTVPKTKGDTINWRKFAALTAATTALSEGQTPTATDVTITSDTATVAEYGAWLQYTDMLEFKSIDPILTNFAELLGEQAGLTVDTLTRDVAVATTNIIYGGDATGRTDIVATDTLTAALVYKALRNLKNANARPIQGDRYIGIMHPYTEFDFLQDSTVVNTMTQVMDKGTGNPLIAGYIGTVFGVDWYRATTAKVYEDGGASSADVYATMIFGRDAIGIGGLAGMMPGKVTAGQYEPNTGKKVSPVQMIKTSTAPTKDDPLGQRGTMGWRTTFVAKILNEDFLIKIEHGATA
jgi:N4-gp56 family major capsid protein